MYVIDHNGEKRGVMDTDDAIALAESLGYDLVEVSPNGNPPVAKIVDYGKMQYEQAKQDRKNKAKAKTTETKGIRLTMGIGDHDMMIRVNQAQKFLDKGHKVKIELQMRGRQKAHPEVAKEKIEQFLDLLEREFNLEQPVIRQGGRFQATISVKK